MEYIRIKLKSNKAKETAIFARENSRNEQGHMIVEMSENSYNRFLRECKEGVDFDIIKLIQEV